MVQKINNGGTQNEMLRSEILIGIDKEKNGRK